MAIFKKLTMGRHCFRGGIFRTKDGTKDVTYRKQIIWRGQNMEAPQTLFENDKAWKMIEPDPVGVVECAPEPEEVEAPVQAVGAASKEEPMLQMPEKRGDVEFRRRDLVLKHSGKGRWSVINMSNPKDPQRMNDVFLTKEEANALIAGLMGDGQKG